MKRFNAIPIYPLRMEGRFGLTWHIFRHGFWSVFFYTLIFALIALLLAAVALSPAVVALGQNGILAKLPGTLSRAFSGALEGLENIRPPHEYFFDLQLPDGAGSLVLSLLASLGLSLVFFLAYVFLLKPLYAGVLYTEMAGRIHGTQGNFRELWQRTGPCFRRYYTTFLAQIAGNLGVSLAGGLLGQLIGVLFSALVLISALAGPLGIGMGMLLLLLCSALVGLALGAFLLLLYPAAVAEQRLGFAALGRSITLCWKNFWRVFSSTLLRILLKWACLLPAGLLTLLGLFSGTPLPFLLLGMGWSALVKLLFVPYEAAFSTVLYQDAAARENQPVPSPAHAAAANPEEATAPAEDPEEATAPEPEPAPAAEPTAEPAAEPGPAEDSVIFLPGASETPPDPDISTEE